MENVTQENTCPECGSSEIIQVHDSGELVCVFCGFVVNSTPVDHGPEWRTFNLEQTRNRSRTGLPQTWTIHDKGLPTVIGRRDRDGHGRRLKPEQKARAYRLRKWHRRSNISGGSERNLAYALSEMNKIAYKLHLPRNVLETASMIYRQTIKKRLIRGRTIEGVAAASIYMACRKCGIIRNLGEIAQIVNLTRKELARNYRFLLKRLRTKVPRIDPKNFVSKFIKQLVLSGETEKIALKIIDLALELKLTSGRGPNGIAAAATYMASILTHERRTQHKIAATSRVTEVTVRNRYKELIKELEIKIEL